MQQNPRRKLSRRCQQIVSRTAAQEIRAGYPRAQAVAIGYSKARKAGCKVPPAPMRLLENRSRDYDLGWEDGSIDASQGYEPIYKTVRAGEDEYRQGYVAGYKSVKGRLLENPPAFWGRYLG